MLGIFLQGEHKLFYSEVWKKELVLDALVGFPSLQSKASIGIKILEITFFETLANYIIMPQMILC